MKRHAPHRFGRQARVNEHPREIGEPSQRVAERAAKLAAKAAFDGIAPSYPSRSDEGEEWGEAAARQLDRKAPSLPLRSDGGEGWGEGVEVGDSRLRVRHGCRSEDAPGMVARSSATRCPLTPTLFPEQARGRGSEDVPLLEVARERRGENFAPGRGCRRYAELHCLSNFSFQRGASSAQELFERAKKLGYAALAITDECSLSGIVRAYEASNDTGVALIVGTEIRLADGPKLVVLAADHDGYSDICQLITTGRRRSAKGEYQLARADAERLGAGVRVLWAPGPLERADAVAIDDAAKWIMQHFYGRAWLAVELHRGPDDAAELRHLRDIGARHGLPLVAAGDAHMHVRRRRALQDALTAIRLGCTVAEAGHALFPNGERHLRRIEILAEIYPDDLLAETLRIAGQCTFNMKKLEYEYPHELVPAEMPDASAYLRELTYAGAAVRWPGGVPSAVREQIEKELALIASLKYEHFFLTVEDIVRWARTRDPPILCQGRGSSANSAVCYCLGITAVTPESGNLLFERFLSKERNEPPDIDVDFEHERREEVIQYVFNKYGRNRAALAATVISYRRKSAVRDVGRALGLSDDALDQLSGIVTRVPSAQSPADAMRERGFDPDSRVLRQLVALVGELRGFPRHLSQHVGGFVISERPLHHLVPVENAAMPDRTIIQWDKDDLETMKLLKVDCLALGMLTCLRKCFDLLRRHAKLDLSLYGIPMDDEKTYDMICRADTVGVFQVESRAQMSMLPRLRPRCFYDLVIEVAIVRPGPIQGNMVHPYLRRRNGQEPVDYPQSKFERESGTQSSRVKDALERTLGVPIFQEQVMKLIQVVAGFTPGEADELRRAMAAWKRKGGLEKFHDRIRNGMLERGYDDAYFERIFEQIKGFGDYGFPESHAASFALLAWASCWLKNYCPAAFTCALLNSQPMGFYQPAQLIQDAKQHGVRVLPADVTISMWDCTLEQLKPSPPSELGGEDWVRGRREEVYERQPRANALSDTLCVEDSAISNAAPSPYPSPPTMKPLGKREQSELALDLAPPGKPSPSTEKLSGARETFALRLGLRLIRGLPEATAQRIVAARAAAPFRDVADLTARARLNAGERACLADAGALRSLSGHRHRARWDIAGTEQPLPVLTNATISEEQIRLRPPSLREDVMNDYATLGLSLTLHPLALIRPALVRRRVVPARATIDIANHGRKMRCAGLVTVRQHPGTAKGVTFVTLEDETGHVNVVVWQSLAEKQHRVLLESAVMGVDGTLEAVDGVYHLIASRLHDYSALLPELAFASRDFH